MAMPPISAFLDPVLRALATRGGEATNAEIRSAVAREMALGEDLQQQPHAGGSTRTELEYRLAWARTKLKKAGKVEARGPRRWGLTPAGRDLLASTPDPATLRDTGR